MPKAIRCCTSLTGRVIQRSLNGRMNLLSICLAHLFAHSTQAILGLQWMLDYEDMPGEYDACEYLWGSERINHPASSHMMTGSPTGLIGSQCVKELVFLLIFLLQERFFGFLHPCFSYIFLFQREVFWGFIFYVWDSFVYFSCFTSAGSGYFERVGSMLGSWVFGDEYLLKGGKCYT